MGNQHAGMCHPAPELSNARSRLPRDHSGSTIVESGYREEDVIQCGNVVLTGDVAVRKLPAVP